MASIVHQLSSDEDSNDSLPSLGVKANPSKRPEPEAVDLTLSSDLEDDLQMIQEQPQKSPSPLSYRATDLTEEAEGHDFNFLHRSENPKASKKLRRMKSKEEHEVTKREREEKKQQREEEKKRRAAEKEAAKARREEERQVSRAKKPGRCLKLLIVELERRLVESKEGGRVLSLLQESEVTCRVVDGPVAASVIFFRVDPLSGKENQAEEAIVVMSIKDFISAVSEEIYGWGGKEGLCNLCTQWQETLRTPHLSLAICGVEDYLRKQKNVKQHRMRAAVLGDAKQFGSVNQLITRVDIETVLVRAQMECQVNHWLLSDGSKLSVYVLQVAKAVSEAPYKQEKSESLFSWYAEGSASNSVRVDKNGVGLFKLWQQQLRQFNHVGLEVAQAVASHYPSPHALVKAYRRCGSRREAELLLADLRVRRGVGPLASEKRVGPELSKKIHIFLTSMDPNTILAST